jgi:hypothetical protein
MVFTRQSCWIEWRAAKKQQHNKDLSEPVKPSAISKTKLCAWCWGQKAIYEAIKVDGLTVAYLPVICQNCDGYGVTG